MFSKLEMDLIRAYGNNDQMSARARKAFLREHEAFRKLLDRRCYAVEDVVMARNLTSVSGDGWSGNIWYDCPIEQMKNNPDDGMFFEDNFLDFPLPGTLTTEIAFGKYAVFGSAGTTITSGTGAGRAELTFTMDGTNEDAAGLRQLAAPFKISRTTGKFWHEAQFSVSGIADTDCGIFVGMCENTAMTSTNIMADDGTLADKNLVGFHRLEGDGDKLDTVYKANGVTQVTVQADAKTLVAATYVNMGMKFDVSDSLASNNLTFYADNLRLSTDLTVIAADGTDFPNDVKLGLMMMIKNAASATSAVVKLRRWRAIQKF